MCRSEASWAKCSDCVLTRNRPSQKSTKNSKRLTFPCLCQQWQPRGETV